ncbi:MAG: acylphosphatase [Romboutsia sp.]|nr:acylphosphatase [Romboutsia sp.]
MNIKEKFKTIRDNYIINQVENIVLPRFESSNVIRKKFIFSGRVQKVGFRLEVSLLAKKLGLTGWVKNTHQGDVEAEIQGEKNKIDFLVTFMKSLKRIKIVKIKEEIIDVVNIEDEFITIK